MEWLYFLVLLLVGTDIILQHYFFGGLNFIFFQSLIPNILTEIIGIAFTLFIVNMLLDKHKRKEEVNILTELLGNEYKILINKLSDNFIQMVTKEPPVKDSNDKNKLNEIVPTIHNYIDKEFLKKPIKFLVINPNNLFKPIEQNVDYLKYLTVFNKIMNESITEFLGRYISVLPHETRNSLFKISNLLKSGLFNDPSNYGIKIDIFKTNINVDDFITIYKELGTEILKLQNYPDK